MLCRIPDQPTLQREVAAWEQRRNQTELRAEQAELRAEQAENNLKQLSSKLRTLAPEQLRALGIDLDQLK